MIDLRLVAAGVIAVALTGSHWYAYRSGKESGEQRIEALWGAERARLVSAAEQARIEREQREADLRREAKEREDAYTEELRRQAGATAAARRELDRLRDAVATDAANRQPVTENPGTRPAPDDARAGDLLGQCAQELVDMGGHADRLAGKVTGLQSYARTAHGVCGGSTR